MKTKMDESKTVTGPTPPLSDDELEKLTAPGGIAQEAFQGGAQTVAAASESKTLAFAIPEGEYKKAGVIQGLTPLDLGEAQYGQAQRAATDVPATDRVSELRSEVMPMINALQSQLEDLNKRAMAVGIGGDIMLTIMRGTIYCPECKELLDGGSMTSQFDSPYVHPSGSAARKPCRFQGKKFEKPRVFTRVLG